MDRLGVLKVDIKSGRQNSESVPKWYLWALFALLVAVFILILIGASVRVMNAGLACPDWPLCFGDVIPDYHPQVYFEFIHRVVAGVVSFLTVSLTGWLVFKSKVSRSIKTLACGTVLLLIVQVVFGGLTVLWQLHGKVVAAHLAMGTGFFTLLWIQYLRLSSGAWPWRTWTLEQLDPSTAKPMGARWWQNWTIGLSLAVYAQIILGGLVASHYAALVCVDFPTCHGEWFPTFRGIIGLQVLHRLGAYILSVLILLNWYLSTRTSLPKLARAQAPWLFGALMLQISIGIANVLLMTPPLIAVMHLAVGTLVLTISIKQAYYASKSG